MKSLTIKKLQQIAKPITFSKDEYICYEGEPGHEMYIVLKGTIGVFISDAMGNPVQVARMKEGDFFGEMAIFDRLPRSASCIALEDAICVSVDRTNLLEFIGECPDMAKKILESMSTRIRKLNNDLYKNTQQTAVKKLPKFQIPEEYGFSHMVKSPYQDLQYFSTMEQTCPICGEKIKVVNMKRHLMTVRNIEMDCRTNYFNCEPLWHEIWSCQHCHYSNYRLNFFDVHGKDVERIRKILKEEQVPAMQDSLVIKTDFDKQVVGYLQAIHTNEVIKGADHALIGTLWLYLYWLAKDSGDMKFVEYCSNHAIEKLQIAVDEKEITEKSSCESVGLSLAKLFAERKMDKQAMKYVKPVLKSMNDILRKHGENLMKDIALEG